MHTRESSINSESGTMSEGNVSASQPNSVGSGSSTTNPSSPTTTEGRQDISATVPTLANLRLADGDSAYSSLASCAISTSAFDVFVANSVEVAYDKALKIHDDIYSELSPVYLRKEEDILTADGSRQLRTRVKCNGDHYDGGHVLNLADAANAKYSIFKYFQYTPNEPVVLLLSTLATCLKQIWKDEKLDSALHRIVLLALGSKYRELVEAIIVVRSAIAHLKCAECDWEPSNYEVADRRPRRALLRVTPGGFKFQNFKDANVNSDGISTIVSMPNLVLKSGEKLAGRAHFFGTVERADVAEGDQDGIWGAFLAQLDGPQKL